MCSFTGEQQTEVTGTVLSSLISNFSHWDKMITSHLRAENVTWNIEQYLVIGLKKIFLKFKYD